MNKKVQTADFVSSIVFFFATRSWSQSIEESAPAQERLRYLSSLSYPPRWELRKGLAQRYAGMGVLGSAAAEFVELEMWEEAVECYRHMQQVSVSLAPTVIGSNGVETPMKSDGNCCRQRW